MKCPHCGKEFEPDEDEEWRKFSELYLRTVNKNLFYPGVKLEEK